ncbi:hypothetical protein FOG48_00045 [Hanseniaspora uvarum]|nr:hypothetical protein FOG48_00045 [Hanseniaspora uvarum]
MEIIAAELLEYEHEMAAIQERKDQAELEDKIENGEIEIIAENDMELNPIVSSRSTKSVNPNISPVVSALESAAIKK